MAGLDAVETAGQSALNWVPPFNLYCLLFLGGNKVPSVPKGWWTSRTLEKFTSPLGLLVLASPVQASFLRVQPPRPLSRGGGPDWVQCREEAWTFRGRSSESHALSVYLAHSILIHSLGRQYSLRISLLQEAELGLRKGSRPLHFSVSTTWPAVLTHTSKSQALGGS